MNWIEQKQVLKYITLNKLLNFKKVWSSYHSSKKDKKATMNGYPVAISLEPTTACNLRCPECPSGLRSFTRETGNLKFPLYKKIIDDMHQHLVSMNFYFQGEPFLNPDFLEMVKYARSKKIYTITSTNAHFFTDKIAKETILSGLEKLIISLDGTTQKTYEQYRKEGKLESVLEGTKKLIEWKKKLNSKTPFISFQFLVVKPNEHQIEDAKILAKKIGVDNITFKTAQIYDFEDGNDLIPTIEKFSRYKKVNEKFVLKNQLENQCWKMWSSCVITWDGKVVPCCFDKDAKYNMGTLNNSAFADIWKSDSYNQFRNSILISRSEIDICKNCSEGTNVWMD